MGRIQGLLFVLFVGLKLTDHIDWSWWWITAPLWGPLAILVPIVIILTVCGVDLTKLKVKAKETQVRVKQPWS